MQSFINATENGLAGCDDLSVRCFGDNGGGKYVCAYIEGLTDRAYVSNAIIMPIINGGAGKNVPDAVTSADVRELTDEEDVVAAVLDGAAAIFSQREGKAYRAAARSEQFRGIDNAGVEEVVRGPHDSFIEDAATNVALVRRRIKNPALKCVRVKIGTESRTTAFVMYLDGVADGKVVGEVMHRIKTFRGRVMHDSGTLETAVLDGRFSVFPLMGNTERPDKAAAKISEGRVAIFVDGSPVVLTAPELFIEIFQSADDYSKSPQYATFARMLRFAAVVLSLMLPAVYLALLEYHRVMIPDALLATLAESRSAVPYGVFAETVVMLFVFDVIREVGQRMPRTMGSVVSLVAGIVLGDAAMSAGLVSTPTLMVIAFAAACAYVCPPVTWTNTLLKFLFVIAAEIGGLFLIVVAAGFLCVYLASKTSFGVPYLSPVAPTVVSGLKDSLIKLKGD